MTAYTRPKRISLKNHPVYWEKDKGTPKTVALMDRMFALVKDGDPESELKYNKFYVGLIKDGRANNYVAFRPNKAVLLFEPKLPRTDETDAILEESGLETLGYSARWSIYRIRVTEDDFHKHEQLFRNLIEKARSYREG